MEVVRQALPPCLSLPNLLCPLPYSYSQRLRHREASGKARGDGRCSRGGGRAREAASEPAERQRDGGSKRREFQQIENSLLRRPRRIGPRLARPCAADFFATRPVLSGSSAYHRLLLPQPAAPSRDYCTSAPIAIVHGPGLASIVFSTSRGSRSLIDKEMTKK